MADRMSNDAYEVVRSIGSVTSYKLKGLLVNVESLQAL